jgi:uncharacterized membrane protein YqaE (UPF0057 family)
MGCMRAIFCVIFPPVSVFDRGCGALIIVTVLTITGFVPGIFAALFINYMVEQRRYEKRGDS